MATIGGNDEIAVNNQIDRSITSSINASVDENTKQHQHQQNPSPTAITETKPPQKEETSSPTISPNSTTNGTSSNITEEELTRVQTELTKSLQDESLLLSLQMQLTVKLEQLKKEVATAETEQQLASLALQQAKVVRLLQSQGTDENEEEVVTIQVQQS